MGLSLCGGMVELLVGPKSSECIRQRRVYVVDNRKENLRPVFQPAVDTPGGGRGRGFEGGSIATLPSAEPEKTYLRVLSRSRCLCTSRSFIHVEKAQ